MKLRLSRKQCSLVFEEDKRTKLFGNSGKQKVNLSLSQFCQVKRILNNHSFKGQTLDEEEPCLPLAPAAGTRVIKRGGKLAFGQRCFPESAPIPASQWRLYRKSRVSQIPSEDRPLFCLQPPAESNVEPELKGRRVKRPFSKLTITSLLHWLVGSQM